MRYPLTDVINLTLLHSVCYKFIRYFYPHLPEKREKDDPEEFPTPEQVANTEVSRLRVGLRFHSR